MDEEDQLELFNSCINSLESCIDTVKKYSDDKAKQIKYLKEVITKEYCNIDLEYERSTEAFRKVEERLNKDDIDGSTDVLRLYENYLGKEKKSDHLTHPVWYRIVKTERDDSLQILERTVNDVDDAEYENIDDSIMCSQTKAQAIDPLTKVAIKKPCKNKRCGHFYDFETISMHIKRKKKAPTCPYLGCTETVRMSDLAVETPDE